MLRAGVDDVLREMGRQFGGLAETTAT